MKISCQTFGLKFSAVCLAVAAIAPLQAANAAGVSFVFYNDVESPISISLDNQSRCTMSAATLPPSGEKCTVDFDGSTSHTFSFVVSRYGYHEDFTYRPGMPVHEICMLYPVNERAGRNKLVDCGDADAADDMPW